MSTYGEISAIAAKAWAESLRKEADRMAVANIIKGSVYYTGPVIRTASKKKKPGGRRTYQLWIDGVFHGHFKTKRERRMYLDATLTLNEHSHGKAENSGLIQGELGHLETFRILETR